MSTNPTFFETCSTNFDSRVQPNVSTCLKFVVHRFLSPSLISLFNFYGIVKRLYEEATGEGSSASSSGFDGASSSKRSKFSEQAVTDELDREEHTDSYVSHQNQPILMDVYVDPVTENEKVIVVASLNGGATDIHFSLIGSGPGTISAQITYSWPKIAFDIEALFEKEIKEEKLPSCHPKIIGLKKCLQDNPKNIDEVPTGIINLTLPRAVQTASATISRRGKKSIDGSQLLIVELLAYENSYTVKEKDSVVKFDL